MAQTNAITPSSYTPGNANNSVAAVHDGGGTVDLTGTAAFSGSSGAAGGLYTYAQLWALGYITGGADPATLTSGTITLGAKGTGISVFDPVTNSNIAIATYNSAAFSVTTLANTAAVNIYQPTPAGGGQFFNSTIAIVDGSGTMNVDLSTGTIQTGNVKQVTYFQTTNGTLNWDSRNTVNWWARPPVTTPAQVIPPAELAPGVRVWPGTFTVDTSDGPVSRTVNNLADFQAYNTWLQTQLGDGKLGAGAAAQTNYDRAISRGYGTTEVVTYTTHIPTPDIPADDPLFAPYGTRAIFGVAGANAVTNISAGAFVGNTGQTNDGWVAQVSNGGRFNNNGEIYSYGYVRGVYVESGGQVVNNGIWREAEAYGSEVHGVGSKFINNGLVATGTGNGWMLVDSGGEIRNTAGATINQVYGVRGSGPGGAMILLTGGGSQFINEAGGTVNLGRDWDGVTDTVIGGGVIGIGLGGNSTVLNQGAINLGDGLQNSVGIYVQGGTPTLLNTGTITVNGHYPAAAGTAPLANYGIVVTQNARGTIDNAGLIQLNGINVIGMAAFTRGWATSSGTINVTDGGGAGGGLRNYGLWSQDTGSKITLSGTINLQGDYAVAAHARSGGAIDVIDAGKVVFESGINQIGFFAYGSGSTISNNSTSAQNVTTVGSTLYRMEDGADFTGAASATSTLTASGLNSTAVLVTGSNGAGDLSAFNSGGMTIILTGAGSTGVRVEGGAQGKITSDAVIDMASLAAVGAVAGIVDGQKHALDGTAIGGPITGVLANGSLAAGAAGFGTGTLLVTEAHLSSTAPSVMGYIARNSAELSNVGTIAFSGAGSVGIQIESGSKGGNTGSVTTSGAGSQAVRVLSASLVNSGTITANGTGVYVEGAGSTIANNDGTILATNGLAAIHLSTGASLNLVGSGLANAIEGRGTAHGVLVGDGAVSLNIQDAHIIVSAAGATGHGVENKAEISGLRLTNTTIDVANGIGLRTGATISATNSGTINVSGSGTGIAFQYADGSATPNSLDLSGSQALNVIVTGAGGTGIFANTTGEVNTAVTVDVQNAAGGSAMAFGNSVGSAVNRGSLTSASTVAPTVAGGMANSFTNTATGVVSNTAANGVAMRFDDQATTVLNAGAITGLVDLGAGNNMLVNVGTITGNVTAAAGDNTLIIDGGTVTGAIMLTGATGTNDVLLENGATLGSFAGSGGADTVTVAGNGNTFGPLDGAAGFDTLVFDRVTGITGADNVLNGAAVTNFEQMNLVNASDLTGYLTTPNMGVGVDATSRWMLTDNSSIGTLTNAGLVDVGGTEGGYRTLTVKNLIGQDGTIRLYTHLGTDGSESDRILVDGGTATGSTKLAIVQAGGLGLFTPGNGILVVDALNGATTGGAFTLAGPVVAGAYEYRLFYGARDGSAHDSWYLRSECGSVEECAVPPPPPPPGCEETNSCPVPPPVVPEYRAEVSLYAVANSMPLIYGRTLLDGLHKRVGEEEDLRGRLGQSGGSYVNGAWGRMIGQFGEIDGNGVRGNGPDYDYKLYTMQSGMDVFRRTGDTGHRDHAGFYLAAGRMEADVTADSGRRAGKNVMDAYSLGGYWTHFGPTGWYVDAVLQGTLYDTDITSVRGIGNLQTDGYGLAASLEAGYPINLGGKLILEPQAQVVWQMTRMDSATDNLTAVVDFADGRSLAGRLGARLVNSWTLQEGTPTASPLLLTAWVSPNVWHEFQGDTHTTVSAPGVAGSGVRFNSDLGGTWGEVNVGVNAQINRATSLIANAGYSFGLGSDVDRTAYEGRVGLRVNW